MIMTRWMRSRKNIPMRDVIRNNSVDTIVGRTCSAERCLMVHLISNGGDGSMALCGAKFISQTTYVIAECTCLDCKAAQQMRAADLPVCTCSTRPTPTTLSIDPNCPVHGSANR